MVYTGEGRVSPDTRIGSDCSFKLNQESLGGVKIRPQTIPPERLTANSVHLQHSHFGGKSDYDRFLEDFEDDVIQGLDDKLGASLIVPHHRAGPKAAHPTLTVSPNYPPAHSNSPEVALEPESAINGRSAAPERQLVNSTAVEPE